MSRGKSEFRFTVHADPAAINDVIQRYLAANYFIPKPKPNANYYFYNDPMLKGKRSFEYYISGSEVLILAYLGTFEKPKLLEGFVAALPKQSYKNDLSPLFMELQRMNNPAMNMGQPDMGQTSTSVDAFVQQNMNKQDSWTIVGFVLSIVGLILAFFGIYYGAIILVLEIYCGIQGLHSRKKGLAIATLVMACVSIALLVLVIALQAALLAL